MKSHILRRGDAAAVNVEIKLFIHLPFCFLVYSTRAGLNRERRAENRLTDG